MNDNELGGLLSSADSAARPPAIANDLASGVRRRLRRRQMYVRATAVALFIISGAVVLATGRFGQTKQMIVQSPPQAVPIEQLRAEAAQLASEAAVHERVAQALLAAREQSLRRRHWQEIAEAPDPLRKVEEARDLAAAILVRHAARMPDDVEQARELYRSAAGLFPDTRAGKSAAEILKQGA